MENKTQLEATVVVICLLGGFLIMLYALCGVGWMLATATIVFLAYEMCELFIYNQGHDPAVEDRKDMDVSW